MGRSLHNSDPLGLLTDTPVEHLRGNTVWFVVGDGESPNRYSLGSVFIADDAVETGEDGFNRYVRCIGYVLRPMPALNDLEWFPDFFKSTAQFSLGVQEIKDQRFIEALRDLAAKARCNDV